jgi:Icc-related predicted phosphoesterase
VHYQLEGLAQAGEGSDLFICLGDLVLFLDYEDPRRGIFSDLFGAHNTRRYIDLRVSMQFDKARAFGRELWEAIGAEPWQMISERVAAQYTDLFAAMPGGLLTYGNVDIPMLWAQHSRDDHQILDGQTVEVGGITFGFVGGGLRTPYRTPFEISDAEFQAKVDRLGPVDVLCSHIPPSRPESCYDVVARRLERGSDALLEYVLQHQPRYLLHGHVHQPLAARTTIGRTEVLNVGHFRARREPFRLEL